jgi:hypothetical protein
MSFGWSVGDIAAAIKVVHNLYQALDGCNGAAGEYRESVSFLQALLRTLEPLRTFSVLAAYPTYAKDLENEVGFLKKHIDSFLEAIRKYDTTLGVAVKHGRHQHMFDKAKWHFSVSKKVVALKKQVEPRLHVLGTLLQRLTLSVARFRLWKACH